MHRFTKSHIRRKVAKYSVREVVPYPNFMLEQGFPTQAANNCNNTIRNLGLLAPANLHIEENARVGHGVYGSAHSAQPKCSVLGTQVRLCHEGCDANFPLIFLCCLGLHQSNSG